MAQIVVDENFRKLYPRCKSCGRPLWTTGSDTNEMCKTCLSAEQQGRKIKQRMDVLCDCGKLAIVDYPMHVVTGSGSEITWLEPLCFPCWKMEVG